MDRGPSFEDLFTRSRQMLLGGALVALAFILWKSRDFIPSLFATRVMATASVFVNKESRPGQFEETFVAAREACRVDAELTPGLDTGSGSKPFDLAARAAASGRARADLATLTEAIKTRFPDSDRSLSIFPANRTTAVPTPTTRRLGLGFRIAAALLILFGEVLMVRSAHRQGLRRLYLLAMLAIVFGIAVGTDVGGGGDRTGSRSTLVFDFIRVMLPVTAVSALYVLVLTRNSAPDPDRQLR